MKKRIPLAVTCCLLSGFVIVWYLFLNPHLCILYREQTRMFLFTGEYFLQYLNQPGGLTAFISSALIPFLGHRPLGAVIYLVIFFLFYGVFRIVLKKFSLFERSFFIAFIPGLLFLPASTSLQFDLADEIAVVVALAGFIVLANWAQSRFYYLLIPLTVTTSFVLVGGNVLLTLALFLLYSLYRCRQNCLPQIAIAALSLSLTAIIWYFFYPVTFENVWQALTPFRYPEAALSDFRVLAWLSVGIIPVAGILLKTIKTGAKWIFAGNMAAAIFILTIVALKNDPILERNIKMGFDAENGRWQAVIEAHRKIPLSPLNCFYTNMALLKTGQMPEKMFYYDQIGTSGLFLTQEDNFSCYAQSELFWQLGLINEAQHYAYESMIGYSSEQEPNIRNMKRLLNCAMVRQDSALTAKYGKILDKTLFYRNYARKNENQKYPEAIVMKDMLIRNISDVLAAILESDSGNRVIFEYLMAWHMLELDYQKAKNCFDRYYSNFSYPHIPTHYAEFLALYKRLNNLDDDFYEQYPVSRYIRERFDMMDILISTEIDEQIQKALENGFKNTYWFYVRFPLIGVSEKQEYKSKIIY